MQSTRKDSTKAELTKALKDACRVLASYQRHLEDIGNESQAEAVGRHIKMKMDVVRKAEVEAYVAAIRR